MLNLCFTMAKPIDTVSPDLFEWIDSMRYLSPPSPPYKKNILNLLISKINVKFAEQIQLKCFYTKE